MLLTVMLQAARILHLHDDATEHWHVADPGSVFPIGGDPIGDGISDRETQLILAQHRANYDLWHQEDQARSPEAAPETIAEVKHAIDRINQRRNDLVEQLDCALLTAAGPQNPDAPLNSETPGLIIDRLSILALKIYHTREECRRPSASDAHHHRNEDRLGLLEHQRDDLAGCLDQLWSDVQAGHRRFTLYRQLKMYNDPELNPVLYRGCS